MQTVKNSKTHKYSKLNLQQKIEKKETQCGVQRLDPEADTGISGFILPTKIKTELRTPGLDSAATTKA